MRFDKLFRLSGYLTNVLKFCLDLAAEQLFPGHARAIKGRQHAGNRLHEAAATLPTSATKYYTREACSRHAVHADARWSDRIMLDVLGGHRAARGLAHDRGRGGRSSISDGELPI